MLSYVGAYTPYTSVGAYTLFTSVGAYNRVSVLTTTLLNLAGPHRSVSLRCAEQLRAGADGHAINIPG